MGRAESARRERPSRRLSFRPRCPKESGASSTFARRLLRPAARLSQAAGLALVLAGLLAVPAASQADVLVSNIGQANDAGVSFFKDFDLAQGFTTGSGSYTLGSIEVQLSNASFTAAAASVVTATLVKDSPTGTSVATLATTDTFLAQGGVEQNITFTAPANTQLVGSTTYYVVLESANTDIRAHETFSEDEDSGGESDWEINNERHRRVATSTGSFETSTGDALMIRVNSTSTTTTSTDATLSALALADSGDNAVAFNETFAPGTVTYTADVGNAVSTLTVTPTTNDANAADPVFLDGTDTTLADADTMTDGFQVELGVGDTVFKVKVTAEDGTTSETYTVTVTRADPLPSDCPADDDWCATLTVGDFGLGLVQGFVDADSAVTLRQDIGALSDGDFTYAGTGYDVWRVSLNDATNPTLQLRFSPSGETVFGRAGFVLNVGGQAFNLSDATYDTTLELFEWANSGLSWSDGDTVTVSLKFAPLSGDATLSALALADSGDNAVAFNETFAPGTVTYTANVDNAVSTLTVTPTTNDAKAREPEFLDVNDAVLADAYTMIDGFQVALGVGDTVFKVKVTAEDGTTDETYTVTVTRALEPMIGGLVENIVGADCTWRNAFEAQSFRTGTDGAYVIDSVVMRMQVLVGFPHRGVVKIRENNTNNRPGALVAELTLQGSLKTGNNTFTAPARTVLAKETTYWITANEGISDNNSRGRYCSDPRNSETGKPGWSIGDDRLTRTSEPGTWTTATSSLVLSIQGRAYSSEATLRALALADGDGGAVALTPAFAIDEMSYTASVANAVDKITVTATPNHANAAEPEFLDGTDATL